MFKGSKEIDKLVKKIYYHDTDCGGVVYYANYLKYLEEARTEFLRERGIDLGVLSGQGYWFVVRAVEIEYKSPARYGDILDIFSQIVKVKNVSLDFFQEIKRKETFLVSAKTVLVFVDNAFCPSAMPEEIRSLV